MTTPKNSTKTSFNPYRPIVRPFFSQINKKPLVEGHNNWFQLKLKQPNVGTEKNYDYSTVPSIYLSNSLQNPININQDDVEIFNSLSTENPVYNYQPDGLLISNTISSQRPNEYSTYGTDGLVVSNSFSTTPRPGGFSTSPNGVNIGNTITLSPEVVSISQGSHTLAGPEIPELPCTNFHIANNLYNKEACQDVEITINNHVHTENNYYEEEELSDESLNQYNDFDDEEEDYQESDEVTENAIITDEDEYADELAQEAVVEEASSALEPALADPLSADSALAEPALAANPAGASPAGAGPAGGSGGGVPARPGINTPGGSNSDDDDDDDGLFSWVSSLNIFNFPLISILAAPLTILFTSALGVSTFFFPWTIFPTLFLGRKARQNNFVTNPSNKVQSRPSNFRPDGWFWHNKYKTWVNMGTKENARLYDDVGNFVIKLIEEFGRRYTRNYNESWKRRKKNS